MAAGGLTNDRTPPLDASTGRLRGTQHRAAIVALITSGMAGPWPAAPTGRQAPVAHILPIGGMWWSPFPHTVGMVEVAHGPGRRRRLLRGGGGMGHGAGAPR